MLCHPIRSLLGPTATLPLGRSLSMESVRMVVAMASTEAERLSQIVDDAETTGVETQLITAPLKEVACRMRKQQA